MRWTLPLALAVPTLVAAVWVTFTSGHGAGFGLASFGTWALVVAATTLLAVVGMPGGGMRRWTLGRAGITAAVGAVALIGLSGALGEETAVLGVTIAVGLGAVGLGDLLVGIRTRRRDGFGTDWLTLGIIGVVTAAAVAVVPPSLNQTFSFSERGGEIVSGAVTATTTIVGLFGAYAAISGVFLAIAAVGLLPSRQRAAA